MFYFIFIANDCGVYMVTSILLSSYGFEANNYFQIHVNAHRKILVFHLAEHLLEVISKELKYDNEESDSDEILSVC